MPMKTNFNFENVPSQKGKTAIVTGANTGLGYETTLYFVKKGIKVVMACRNIERAKKAKEKIIKLVPEADVDVIIVDLSKFASVKNFADQFRKKYKTIDYLINNAGVMYVPYSKTEDGCEKHMAANYYGHFLLSSLLIDLMPDLPESRIVTLSSIAHKTQMGVINFEDIHFEKKYNKQAAYSQSKLACLMFSLELQRRLEKSGKKILSLGAHPGVSLTELARYTKKWQVAFLKYTFGPFVTHTPYKAALPTVMAAFDPILKGGEYIGPTGFMEMKGNPGKAVISDYAQREDMAKQLWELSEKYTGANFNL